MLKVKLFGAVVLSACLVLLVAPVRARAALGCPAQPVAAVFWPWGDPASYTLLPDGGMETRRGAWSLQGAASFVAGNEPFRVRAHDDVWSLAIPVGSSALSAPTCIELGHPTLRFFARNTGQAAGALEVLVEFVDVAGFRQAQRIASLTATSAWGPTPVVPIFVNLVAPLMTQEVMFRLRPVGGNWRVDDVYVDPYGKG